MTQFRFYKKKITLILTLCLSINLGLRAAVETASPGGQQTIYDRLASLYLPCIADKEPEENAINAKIKQDNAEFFKQKKIHQVQIADLKDAEKIRLMYQLLSTIEPKKAPTVEECAIASLCQATHLLSGSQSNPAINLFERIDFTQTAAGKIELQKMLMDPLNSILPLQERQYIIQALVEDEGLFKKLDAHVAKLAAVEKELLWFWKDQDAPTQLMSDELFFKNFLCKGFNQSPFFLLLDSLRYNALHHILGAGIPLIGMSLCMEIFDQGQNQYGYSKPDSSVLFLAYSGAVLFAIAALAIPYFYTIPKAAKFNAVSSKIQKKLIGSSSYLRTLTAICKDARGKNIDKLLPPLKNFAAASSFQAEAKQLETLLSLRTFTGSPSKFSDHGAIAVAYKLMLTAKHNLIKAIQGAGQLDAYLSLAKIYKVHEENPQAPFCFAQFIAKEKPQIIAENFWSPTLNNQTPSLHSINLGSPSGSALITGQHSSGKSTILKSLALTVLFAQSFGIAPARSLTMTPLESFLPYIAVPTSIGQSSLENEITLLEKYSNRAHTLPDTQFSLVILDEPLRTTDEQTRQASVEALTQTFGALSNNICVLATNATTSCPPTVFKQYHTSATNGTVLLKQGPGVQANPIEILAKEGFKKQMLVAANEQLSAIHQLAK